MNIPQKILLFTGILLALTGKVFTQEAAHANDRMSPYDAKGMVKGSKSILLSEDFGSGSFPPEGWSLTTVGYNNWSVLNSTFAGGTAPEVYCGQYPVYTGTSRLISPPINTTEYTALLLTFKQFLSDLGGSNGFTISLETTSNNGADWNTVWSFTENGSSLGPEEKILVLNNDDVGSGQFQFAFTFNGSSTAMVQWNIDDVVLKESYMYDAEALAVFVPGKVEAGKDVTLKGHVRNSGSESIDFDVTLEIKDQGGNTLYSENAVVNQLGSFESTIVGFPSHVFEEGIYSAELSVILEGDQHSGNDHATRSVESIEGIIFLKPLYEEFTSSTCTPCAEANPILDAILEANPGGHSLIKYQMNWPWIGDPYYTEEGGSRKDYYDIAFVPDLFINSNNLYPADLSQEIYDSYLGAASNMMIQIDASVGIDYQLNVTTEIDVTEDLDSGLKAHIVVVEGTTVFNASINGETTFHSVMMKMLPDAAGTPLPALTPGNTETITAAWDMSLTFVEEPSDLRVVVFVQDDNDKSVIQSEEVEVLWDISPYIYYEPYYAGLPDSWKAIFTGPDVVSWADGHISVSRGTTTNEPLLLVSPAIETDSAGILYFDAIAQAGTAQFMLGTMEDQDDPETFVQLAEYTPTAEWETFEFDLAAINGTDSTVFLAWMMSDLTPAAFGIDNIALMADTSSVTNINESTPELWQDRLTVYPNPVTDQLYIRSEALIGEVRIINQAGQLVYAGFIAGPMGTIDTSAWEKGLYLIISGKYDEQTVNHVIVQ